MSGKIQSVTDASFDAIVLKSTKPVLVDFWAEWCGPCKMVAPLLDAASVDHADAIDIVKMDVDANQLVPGSFGVRGIPTLIIFKNGKAVAQRVGAMSKGQLDAFIAAGIQK
jgi:thioredoxin 1